MELTGAQILAESLIEQGVEVVFGYPGGQVINIYDALYDKSKELRHILASHEQGAAHAADGYARSTGKTGVVIATSGPGATNLVTGLATAHLDSVPLVAITGNVPQDLLGRDSFQEVDIVGVTVPVTKHNFFVSDVNQLARIIREAFVIANSGRRGPVLIDIPKDVQVALTKYVPAGRFEPRPIPEPVETEMNEAARMIQKAKKPLIYFGGGITASNASEELIAFAEKIQAPMISSAMGLSAVPSSHPLYLGLVGMHGTPVANHATEGSDLLITVGARFSERNTGNKSKFLPNAKVIHIDIDVSEVNKNIMVDLEIGGDAKKVITALTQRVQTMTHTDWLSELSAYSDKTPLPLFSGNGGVDLRKVLNAIHNEVGDEVIMTTDVGQHQMITAQYYQFEHPRTFISSCGLGTMGYGLGAANGVQVGNPDKPVALITGDGCFHMNMAELAVAVTEKLPLAIFIMNNTVLGMVRQWQKLFFNHRFSATTLNRSTDYVKIAEAFGAVGIRVTSNDEVDAAVKRAFKLKKPVVVECVISEEDSVFPIIPPGGSVGDMITGR